MSYPAVMTGADILEAAEFEPLKGRRAGLICNPTTVNSRLQHLADLLHHDPGIELVALFGPEHGIRGEVQDMLSVRHDCDPATGLPVHSLYGANEASLTPTRKQLEGLDLIVFDIQDVGSRYYTFAATMLYSMKAATQLGLSFLVLDRPNPIGGEIVEGPAIQPGFESFVGAYPLPSRNGLTVGELALMFRDELNLDLDLEVIPCQGWTRDQHWPATGLPWVSPSPNMPSYLTALVYPGACLLEGTNLSEGRGTTRPFELWGAPWSKPAVDHFLAELNQESTVEAMGAWGRYALFVPTFHKHAGLACHGIQPFPTNPASFLAMPFYLAALGYELATPETRHHFHWRTDPYEFVSDPIAIDLLFGSSREREILQDRTRDGHWSAAAALEITSLWTPYLAEFQERRKPYLLYDQPPIERLFWSHPTTMSENAILRVDGEVQQSLDLTLADLLAFPASDRVEDVSRFHPARKGDGVTLEALLVRCVPLPGANYLTLHAGRDDFHVSIPLAPIRAEGIVVFRVGDQPLGVSQGGPVRFLIRDPAACHTHELDDCANVKYLDRIELTTRKGRDTRPADEAAHADLHARQAEDPPENQARG